MNEFVTIELLDKMPSGNRACEEARAWFAETFPVGGLLKDVWERCENTKWKIWFAVNYLPKDKVTALSYRFCGQAFRYAARHNPSLAKFSDNVSVINVWEAIPAADAAAVGAYALADAAAVGAYALAAADAADAAADAAYALAAADAADAVGAYALAAAVGAYALDALDAADAAAARREQLKWCLEILTKESINE
jgi:hypothetical protein